MHQLVLAALGLRGGGALLLGGLAGPCCCQVCLRDVPGHPNSLAIPDPNTSSVGGTFALHTCSAGQPDLHASRNAQQLDAGQLDRGSALRAAVPGSSP